MAPVKFQQPDNEAEETRKTTSTLVPTKGDEGSSISIRVTTFGQTGKKVKIAAGTTLSMLRVEKAFNAEWEVVVNGKRELSEYVLKEGDQVYAVPDAISGGVASHWNHSQFIGG